MSVVEPGQAPCLSSSPLGHQETAVYWLLSFIFIGEQIWPVEIGGFTQLESEWVRQLRFLYIHCVFHIKGGIPESSVMCPVLSDTGQPKHQKWKSLPAPCSSCPQSQESLHIIKTMATFQKKPLGLGTHCLEPKSSRTVIGVQSPLHRIPSSPQSSRSSLCLLQC